MAKQQNKNVIPAAHLERETARLQFSFKLLDEKHSKFNIDSCSQAFLMALLLEVKNYSEYTEEQFTDQNNEEHRHRNFWSDTAEKNGFRHLSEEIQNEYSWQFALSQSPKGPEARWRVHGMLVGNVFYVVWLDPEHKLCPDKRPNHSGKKTFSKKK